MGAGPFTLAEAEEEASREVIASLDVSAFGETDALNLILQRSDIIEDRPDPNGQIKAWQEGDDTPLLESVNLLGTEALVRRAAAFIHLEYREMRSFLSAAPMARVTDIGCGYAFFDLFLERDFEVSLTLIDLEASKERHFGFKDTGAAYSSLDVARLNLERNGVKAEQVVTINPEKSGLDGIAGQDLVMSFLSCGFHYPWTTYEAFFRNAVSPRGRVVLDLRRRMADGVAAEMGALGAVERLNVRGPAKAVRVCLTRAAN